MFFVPLTSNETPKKVPSQKLKKIKEVTPINLTTGK